MFHYALYMKLESLGKLVKFDDINEYRGERAYPIMLAVFGVEYPRASWDEIIEFTDGSMEIRKRIKRKLFGRKAIEYVEQGGYDPKVLSFESMYLRGAFQSEKYFRISRMRCAAPTHFRRWKRCIFPNPSTMSPDRLWIRSRAARRWGFTCTGAIPERTRSC